VNSVENAEIFNCPTVAVLSRLLAAHTVAGSSFDCCCAKSAAAAATHIIAGKNARKSRLRHTEPRNLSRMSAPAIATKIAPFSWPNHF
jgi:hypothetical protein